MAIALSSESSTKLADSQLYKDLNKIWPEYHKYIDCDSTERIKWLRDLDVLKQFVRNVGKWSPAHLVASPLKVIAKGDAREVSHTISDSSQYLACIMFINLFNASIKV